MTGSRISVVVVGDDTESNRALRCALEADGDITVVAESPVDRGPRSAHALGPDLIALHMPGAPRDAQGCLAAVRQVMGHLPTPILLITPVNGDTRSSDAAIAAGALQALVQPPTWDGGPGAQVRRLVRTLSGVVVLRHPQGRVVAPRRQADGSAIVGIASSTGGPQALARVLGGLGGLNAPVLVVQHIHEDFIEGLVTLLRRGSALPVELAEDSAPLRPGVVYVAQANRHLALGPQGRAVLAAEPAAIHRPSADVLFHSLAAHAGAAGVGVVLTGMGDDGAAGLLALRQRGGTTIGQDEASCAVYGMPRAAWLLGAVEHVAALDQVATAVCRATAGVRR
jgi:two-component system chemotaxis response regulator CheB